MGSVERGGIDAPHLEEAQMLLETLSAENGLDNLQQAWELNEMGVSAITDSIYRIKNYRELLSLTYDLANELIWEGARKKLYGFASGRSLIATQHIVTWADFKHPGGGIAISAYRGPRRQDLSIALGGWELAYSHDLKEGEVERSCKRIGPPGEKSDALRYRNPPPKILYDVLRELREVATQYA